MINGKITAKTLPTPNPLVNENRIKNMELKGIICKGINFIIS